jgi:hypothetical protein
VADQERGGRGESHDAGADQERLSLIAATKKVPAMM